MSQIAHPHFKKLVHKTCPSEKNGKRTRSVSRTRPRPSTDKSESTRCRFLRYKGFDKYLLSLGVILKTFNNLFLIGKCAIYLPLWVATKVIDTEVNFNDSLLTSKWGRQTGSTDKLQLNFLCTKIEEQDELSYSKAHNFDRLWCLKWLSWAKGLLCELTFSASQSLIINIF